MTTEYMRGFLKLNLFKISPDRQGKVYEQIKENAEGDFDFFVLNIFSSIIITLGLLIDSGAVVIGGMLIAPLVWPIFLLSVAIVMGRTRILEKALFTLAKAIVVIFLVSLVIGFFVPDIGSGQEILSRTHPTIFELIIALASGFVGAFVISYPKLGSAMAGVAVAAALVPPLAVAGLSVSQNDMQSAGGSFLLFLSNLIAITFAAGALFLFAKFRGPATEEGKEIRRANIRWFIVLLLVVLIPLYLITRQSLQDDKRENIVRQVFGTELPTAKITDILQQEQNQIVEVNVTVQSDQGITKWEVTRLTEILSRSFERSVVLKITVVPVVEAGKLLPQSDQLNDQPATSTVE